MKIRPKQIFIVFLSLTTLLGCSNAVSNTIEEKFEAVIPLADMNESLVIKVDDDDDKVFRLGSDIPVIVENKSTRFIFLNLADENYTKLFTIRDGEWVEVRDEITRSGSKVLSPQGPPLLNISTSWVQPVFDDTIFQDNKTNILIRIVITGEVMEMDTYSSDWRDHEDDILTGKFVGAYVDVYINP